MTKNFFEKANAPQKNQQKKNKIDVNNSIMIIIKQ